MTPLSASQNPGTGLLANCVIWDGPDIPCLKLCRGDTITTVIYELGRLLCEQASGLVDVSLLELACLLKGEVTKPETVSELLQLLIHKLCQLDEAQQESAEDPDGDPLTNDGLVRLPEGLQQENGDGSLVVSLPVPDYLIRVAEEVVSILDKMQHELTRFDALLKRVSNLEAAVNKFSRSQQPTSISFACLLDETTLLTTEQALELLERTICESQQATGTPDQLLQAVQAQCAGLSASPQQANPTLTMSQLAGWVLKPRTVADALTNLWLTLCDQRSLSAGDSNAELPVDPMRFSVNFEPGGSSSVPIQITNALEVGSYELDPASPPVNLSSISFLLNGTPATLPLTLSLGDTLTVSATTTQTLTGTLVLLQR